MQRDFWVKNGVLGEMSVQKDFGLKMVFWGKWACKGTFELKWGLGEVGVQRDFWVKLGWEMGMQRNI